MDFKMFKMSHGKNKKHVVKLEVSIEKKTLTNMRGSNFRPKINLKYFWCRLIYFPTITFTHILAQFVN